ncbi:MAG: polyprenol monophosphomannose synthase [Acidimicrobiales bacterium]
MRVLVVLPTFNEAATIGSILDRVRKALPDASVLVVDDNSPDGTARIVAEVAERFGNVEVLGRRGKLGLGSAYRDGFAWGLERGYEAFVEMDSDFSHDPDVLPTLIAPLGEGYEVCIGSRYVPGGSIPNWSLPRRLLSRGGNVYADILLGLKVRDSTAGFRAYAVTVLRRIDLDSVRAESYGFQIEMTYRAIEAGARVREIPIRFVDRELGTSKMSAYTVVEALALVTWWGAERVVGRLRGGASTARAAAQPPLSR